MAFCRILINFVAKRAKCMPSVAKLVPLGMLAVNTEQAVWNQWNGTVEWSSGMEYWN